MKRLLRRLLRLASGHRPPPARVIHKDALDAIGEELLAAMEDRIREQLTDAGVLVSDDDSPPPLYVIHGSKAAKSDNPLESIRNELVAAGYRLKATNEALARARGRRRRRLAAAASMIAVLLVGGGGAAALLSGTTGVDTLDRFLEIHDRRGRDGVGATAGHARRRAPHLSRSFKPVEATPPVRLRVEGFKDTYLSGFVTADHQACVSVATNRPQRSKALPLTTMICQPSTRLVTQTLASTPAYLVGLRQMNGGTVYYGYARPEIKTVMVRDSHGRLVVRLSGPMTLDSDDRQSARVFAAIDASSSKGTPRLSALRLKAR